MMGTEVRRASRIVPEPGDDQSSLKMDCVWVVDGHTGVTYHHTFLCAFGAFRLSHVPAQTGLVEVESGHFDAARVHGSFRLLHRAVVQVFAILPILDQQFGILLGLQGREEGSGEDGFDECTEGSCCADGHEASLGRHAALFCCACGCLPTYILDSLLRINNCKTAVGWGMVMRTFWMGKPASERERLGPAAGSAFGFLELPFTCLKA